MTTNDLDTLQQAMNDQVETTEQKKTRASARTNAFQAVLDLITNASTDNPGMIEQWNAEEPEGDIRDAVLSALETLRTKVQSLKDEPRDPSEAIGKWYLGIHSDGTRKAFKSAATPTEKSVSCALFNVVTGPYHTRGGAEFAEKNGRKADDALVFNRRGTSASLGQSSVKKSFR